MTRLRFAVHELVFLAMDEACRVTGHRLWNCYNDAPEAVKRLWRWSVL